MKILILLFLSANLSFAASPADNQKGVDRKSFALELRAGEKLLLMMNDSKEGENTIDISLDGKFIQSEAQLGDRFVSFVAGGKPTFAHAQDIDGDGTNEIIVRLYMAPIGVVRVFKWLPNEKKFYRMLFGSKREDGLFVSARGKVTLQSNGNLEYAVKPAGEKKVKTYRYTWAPNGYGIPAKELP